MRNYKIRFNLGKGSKYMKWKVEDVRGGYVQYFDPNEYQLTIYDGVLFNREYSATRIFEGANKFPCAWIMAESIEVKKVLETPMGMDEARELRFNPRVAPFWTSMGMNVDGAQYDLIISSGKKVFTVL